MNIWTQDQIMFLLILRDVLNLQFSDCADNMQREFKMHFSTNACIGQYQRAKKRKMEVPKDIIDEVMNDDYNLAR